MRAIGWNRIARVGAIVLMIGTNVPGPARSDSLLLTSPSQPANVGDAMLAAANYHDSGDYDRDLAAVAKQAGDWVVKRAMEVPRPALVLDIDETALANWEVITRDNFGRPIGGACDIAIDGPCGWAAWDQLAKDPAIDPVLEVFRQRERRKSRCSSSPDVQRTSVRQPNRTCSPPAMPAMSTFTWSSLGPNTAPPQISRHPSGPKSKKAGYTIIANVGDQPSDLFGGHAEKLFLLPNPFYRVR